MDGPNSDVLDLNVEDDYWLCPISPNPIRRIPIRRKPVSFTYFLKRKCRWRQTKLTLTVTLNLTDTVTVIYFTRISSTPIKSLYHINEKIENKNDGKKKLTRHSAKRDSANWDSAKWDLGKRDSAKREDTWLLHQSNSLNSLKPPMSIYILAECNTNPMPVRPALRAVATFGIPAFGTLGRSRGITRHGLV